MCLKPHESGYLLLRDANEAESGAERKCCQILLRRLGGVYGKRENNIKQGKILEVRDERKEGMGELVRRCERREGRKEGKQRRK